MSVLRGIAPFRSSSTLQKTQINERKFVIFARHRTIQIVFHPAKEANKCAKTSHFCSASLHPDRLPPCAQKNKRHLYAALLQFRVWIRMDPHCFWKLDPDQYWSEKMDPAMRSLITSQGNKRGNFPPEKVQLRVLIH
jgi:hypothetical protein